MANPEQVERLAASVDEWNYWRRSHQNKPIDLSHADLPGADLSGANLFRADLLCANLSRGTLSRADLSGANLVRANLSGANFFRADLSDADLSSANLSRAQLVKARLSGADLSGADMSDADIRECFVGWTTFARVNLSEVRGLDTVNHRGPSSIGIDTIYASAGLIPEVFLQRAGVPDSFIKAIPSLLTGEIAARYYSCFISYSSKDQSFAEQLYAGLQEHGVRCWLAVEDLDIGKRLRDELEKVIRGHEKVIVIVSEHSLASPWVQREMDLALEREQVGEQTVVFPIRIDDAVKTRQSLPGWAGELLRSRHIGDFTEFQSSGDFLKALERLLRALRATDEPCLTLQ